MAKSADLVKEVLFGFDKENFYLALQWTGSPPLLGGDAVRLKFTAPRNAELWLGGLRDKTKGQVKRELRGNWAGEQAANGRAVEAAHDRMLEVAIPWQVFGQVAGEKLAFSISVESGGHVQEEHPSEGVIALQIPSSGFTSDDWLV